MIKGLGLDLCEINRIQQNWERFKSRFIQKILTEKEIEQLPQNPVPRLAALFAGKEAAVKALGTGFSGGIHFHCIEILHTSSGKPEIFFLGKGLKKFAEIGATSAHITLTHSRDTAAATVVLEG
ncbi:holo-[acyl-carrier-protein] synthase [Pseudodesulfovibrio piezophilus]|uniref:Holo-[acyl-carrier-protein] synthase n=1 Tax=Pseudodesulfovibrio piezophilus (strain DSM 21447 / JCM 15486 / C1TLV30) TaxID=1322246 RepID=M1WUP9_PSEP2|nr:holo-[acyl-carrier-protein] synthase [Pseudodesulfovibrio piezophilus]CCH47718.1 Holo-[acyl-carrier-protein] synthase [Pseudodesulfovibrio piezophilus C1TLV30]